METQNQRYKVSGLLMVGGASRNVGKTTLVCNIIKHFSDQFQITGLKIKTINKDDIFFHGKNSNLGDRLFELYDESESGNVEDSSRMLHAGALRAFRLKTYYKNLGRAFAEFLTTLPKDNLIVCESNSLMEFVAPDVFILIKDMKEDQMKPSALRVEKYADKILFTNGISYSFDIAGLKIDNNQWIINQENLSDG